MTALLSWMQMRKVGGAFVLRMEDIDWARCRTEYAVQILHDLRWLGIDWDEGPDVGGPYGPYVQSARLDRYQVALGKLDQAGWVYPCYCSRADMGAVASAPHNLHSEGGYYPGTCRDLKPEQRMQKAKGKAPSTRFRMPDKPTTFIDRIAGPQWFPPFTGGDFVVHRADGVVAYQLSVVVDDAAMNMTDVLRGWDLLDSTPRQIALYEAMGLTPPRFAHVPLLLDSDGRRLSKRHASMAISALREAGKRPEEVIGVLAYLCGLVDCTEPIHAKELIATFAEEKLVHQPVVLSAELVAALSPKAG